MGGHVAGGGGRSRAADILPPEVDPRDQRAQRGSGSARREGIEDVTIQHLLPGGALQVNHRRLSGDRDRLFKPADAEVGVDPGVEGALQRDAFPPHDRETRQRERHRVLAGPQVLDYVLTGAVRHGRPDLLD